MRRDKRTFIDVFKDNVKEHPHQLLYVFLDIHGQVQSSYTYEQFDQRSVALAASLVHKERLISGDRVLLAYPPGLEMMVAFFASIRAGLIPVPVYPPTSNGFSAALEKMTFIAKDCGAVAILTDRTLYWSMRVNMAKHSVISLSLKKHPLWNLHWIITSDITTQVGPLWEDCSNDLMFLQYTSGSTNDPKGVMVHQENILSNCDAVVDHKPIGVSWLPQYHDMGLIGYYLFFALKSGTTYGFSPLDFIQRPALWFETITRFRGTATSAPNFAYEYCLREGKINPEEFKSFDLSSLVFVMTAAEPVNPVTCERFKQRFSTVGLHPSVFFAAYGLAEFTLAVTNYGRHSVSLQSKALKQHTIVFDDTTASIAIQSCGKALGDTQIRIVREEGESNVEVQEGIGEIWLQGSGKCKGYWNKPALTQALFEAILPGQEGTWLRTGDLGFLHEGSLFVCGRVKDMILIRGLNYYPQDIESIIEKHPSIRKGCVAAFSEDSSDGERLIVVAECKKGAPLPDFADLNGNVSAYLGIGMDKLILLPPRNIPKTSSGKLRRSHLRDLYLSGQLSEKVILTDSQKPGPSTTPIAALLTSYGLTGSESNNLVELGFDSIRIVEFAHDVAQLLSNHGFSHLSQELDLRILQRIAIQELTQVLQDVLDLKPQSTFLFKKMLLAIHTMYTEEEQAMMKNDASSSLVTDPIKWKEESTPTENILLTGASGFFGPFLLKSLLEITQSTLYVLLRAAHEEEGLKRLKHAFETTHPTPEQWHAFNTRVRVCCGDLTKPLFGLDATIWDNLASCIDVIYHNGARVNYLLDYANMRDANVMGTTSVLTFANAKKIKPINYISTTFIFGWSVKETLFESDCNRDMEHLDFGYSQSKWAAEQVMLKAMEAGFPVRIFRPALISPSIDGRGFNYDISIRLLRFMIKNGISTTAKNQVSFTPADIGANNIVAISLDPESMNHCFHVTRDSYSNMDEICTMLAEKEKTPLKRFPLKAFVPEVVTRCKPDDMLFPLLNFLVKSVDNIAKMEFKAYDNAVYRRFRDKNPRCIQDPSLEAVVEGIYIFMKKEKLL
jgi:thioester reductase-like protein